MTANGGYDSIVQASLARRLRCQTTSSSGGPYGSSEANAITEDHLISPQARLRAAGHGEGQERHPLRQAHGAGAIQRGDEKGRSLKADRRVKAKTRTKSGYGDRGDRAA